MHYPDGGELTAEGRCRREAVRFQKAAAERGAWFYFEDAAGYTLRPSKARAWAHCGPGSTVPARVNVAASLGPTTPPWSMPSATATLSPRRDRPYRCILTVGPATAVTIEGGLDPA